MAEPAPASQALNADAICSREPIHIPGAIQSHGILLAADPAADMALVAASANAATLPTAAALPTAVALFGAPIAALLGTEFAAALRHRANIGALLPETPWETALVLPGQPAIVFEAACHEHAGLILIELEPVNPGDGETALAATRRLQHAIARLRSEQGGLNDLALEAVRGISQMTGYERVLVYRFDRDWNGQAIAEEIVPDWAQPLGGLHFPASDIPAQARALYERSLLRWVPDRDADPVPLILAPGRIAPVDLSHARLRALSPIHLQYHRNMGVVGSMSLSILVGERLWGLIVCHHRQPHRTSAGQRAAAAALTDAFALRVVPAERAGSETARRAEHRRISELIAHMAQVDELQPALTTGPVTLLSLFGAVGAALVQGTQISALGRAPPAPGLAGLAAWLRDMAPPGESFATDTLPDHMADWGANAALASGLLAVFLTEDRADMLLWFRPEEPHEVSWGGPPIKARTTEGVLPRQSFERWVEIRHGHARPWQEWEIEVAALLRHAITEVIVRNLRRIGNLNEQLRQSQKMEAVGQLTGGLAHDFNNLLGGISGSLELARARLAQGRTDGVDRFLAAATGSANRAAALTHRLLAFSRRQTLDPKPVDAARLIHSLDELVRRTLSPAIQLDCVTSAGLWTILCDANQLENALLNLVLNARDAMPQGGRLTIEATNARVDDDYAGQFGIPPGHYVAFSVSDTGTGMAPETVQRAFEPFFTTKPIGEGTGLGLSMIYGFTKQSGGHARIYSELQQGTTVRLYLPRHSGPPAAEARPPTEADPASSGAATVMVVDDEPVLRMLVGEVLQEMGLTVLEASNGPEALAILQGARSVDLLITDVGLPGGLNGRQVADAARVSRPGLKVLFITGYAENAALGGGLLDPATQVLTKPFEVRALTAKVLVMLG